MTVKKPLHKLLRGGVQSSEHAKDLHKYMLVKGGCAYATDGVSLAYCKTILEEGMYLMKDGTLHCSWKSYPVRVTKLETIRAPWDLVLDATLGKQIRQDSKQLSEEWREAHASWGRLMKKWNHDRVVCEKAASKLAPRGEKKHAALEAGREWRAGHQMIREPHMPEMDLLGLKFDARRIRHVDLNTRGALAAARHPRFEAVVLKPSDEDVYIVVMALRSF